MGDDAGPTGVRAGFIGLGQQGAPMARRIIDAGIPTSLWARREASLDPFRSSAARIATSPADLGAASDVVCLCVFGDDDVREVVGGGAGVLAGLRPGSVLVVHSTVDPRTIVEVAAMASPLGVEVLDAPVSGGGDAALAGRLCVMAGGSPAAFARAREVLATFAEPLRRVGPLGTGAVTKLINNILFTASIGLADEALALAGVLGADRAEVATVLGASSANSYALGVVSRMPRGRVDLMEAAGPVLRKDFSIVTDLLRAAAVTPGSLEAAAADTLRDVPRPESEVSS